MKRILITGSREFLDWEQVEQAILEARHDLKDPEILVVHGHCLSGADALADDVASYYGWPVERHPADWDNCSPDCKPGHRRRRQNGEEYCPTAGHRRNQEMVDLGADVCLAFFKTGAANRGTSNCAAKAKRAGIPVRKFYD